MAWLSYDSTKWETYHLLDAWEELRGFAPEYRLWEGYAGFEGNYQFKWYPSATSFGYTAWESGDAPLQGPLPVCSSEFFYFLQRGIYNYMRDIRRVPAWEDLGLPTLGRAYFFWEVFCKDVAGLVDGQGNWGFRYVESLDAQKNFIFSRANKSGVDSTPFGRAKRGHYAGPHLMEDLDLAMEAISLYFPVNTITSTPSEESSSESESSVATTSGSSSSQPSLSWPTDSDGTQSTSGRMHGPDSQLSETSGDGPQWSYDTDW